MHLVFQCQIQFLQKIACVYKGPTPLFWTFYVFQGCDTRPDYSSLVIMDKTRWKPEANITHCFMIVQGQNDTQFHKQTPFQCQETRGFVKIWLKANSLKRIMRSKFYPYLGRQILFVSSMATRTIQFQRRLFRTAMVCIRKLAFRYLSF